MKNLEYDNMTKRVLVLALSGIGNLVMQLPAIQALKKAHPDWYIAVWVAPRGTKELAEAQSCIDEVIEAPYKVEIPGMFVHIMNLRKKRFDIGIVLSPGQLIKSALFLRFAGIPVRIGNTYPLWNNPSSRFSLTHAIEEEDALHDVEQNLKLLEPLGISPEAFSTYSLEIPEINIKEASGILATSYKLQATSYVGIHAGSAAGFEWKRWPIERFAEVARALIGKAPDTKVLVFGSKSEEAQKEELIDLIGRDNAVNVSASLMTTAAMIKNCTLFISNDSGLMHIAAAVGVPMVSLFGPTDERLTGPRSLKAQVVRAPGTKSAYITEEKTSFNQAPHNAILAISPKQVLDSIDTMSLYQA